MSAYEALQMAEKLSEMGVEDGNIDYYMRQGVYNDYLLEFGEPEFGTSDFIATVPMVYMIANGLELLLKAYVYAAHVDETPKGPLKLKQNLERFKADFPEETVIIEFLETYTEDDKLPELLARFLHDNEMTIDDLYKERRFLNNTSFFNITDRYKRFLYTWDEGREFYQKVLSDVKSVLPIIDELQRDIDSDANPGEKVLALLIH
jgi:hypothetical protein